jgi:outer membrane protein TolC
MMLAPTALAAQASADSVARPISLDEAVKLAQRNSPTTVQAAGATRSNAASVRTAYLSFIPSLSFNTGASKQNGDRFNPQGELVPFTGAAWQYSSGLRMNVDIFDAGNRVFRLKSAKASVNSSEANETLRSSTSR